METPDTRMREGGGRAARGLYRALTGIFVVAGAGAAGWFLTLAAYVAATQWAGLQDREGAAAMGIVFVIGPIVGTASGLAALVAMLVRGR